MKHTKYRADIDGLRAIAIIAVLIFHGFPKILKGGFFGVDIFFVISGFLISTFIFLNIENQEFSFSNFYSRRIKRIFPSLIVVLVCSGIAGWFLLLPDEFMQLGKHIFSGSVFLSNYTLNNESGYFDNSAETKPLLHLWSLAIEEQFYIFWPILLSIGYKAKKKGYLLVIAVFLASFLLNIYFIKIDPTFTFYSIVTRSWELMIGGLLAFVMIKKPKLLSGYKPLASILGVLLIGIGLFVIDKSSRFPGFYALLPSLGAALIIFAGNEALFNRYILQNKMLVFVGLISYPLYLWHWPLLSFAHIIVSTTPSEEVRFSALIIAVIFAYLTYRFIERPIRFGANQINYTFWLVFGMVLVGSSGGVIYLNNGFEGRMKNANFEELTPLIIKLTTIAENDSPKLSDENKGIPPDLKDEGLQINPQIPSKSTEPESLYSRVAAIYPNKDPYKEFVGPLWKYSTNQLCLARLPFPDAKIYGWWFCSLSKDKAPSILLMGISHSNSLYPGLVNLLPKQTILSFGTCPIERQNPASLDLPTDNTPCSGYKMLHQQEYINNMIKNNKSLKYAIVAGIEGSFNEDRIARFRQTVDFLEQQNIRVILVSPNVRPSYDVKGCLPRPSAAPEYDCIAPLSERASHDVNIKPLFDSLKKTNPKVLFFDSNDMFCNEKECSYMLNGMPAFRDEFAHFSEYASNLQALYFERWAKNKLPEIFQSSGGR